MAKYKIEIKRSAEKELKKIPKQELQKIINKINSLSSDPTPFGCKKLTNQEIYRVRVGNYRVLYHIKNAILTITVVKVAHRKLFTGIATLNRHKEMR